MRSRHRQQLSRPAPNFAELDRLELAAALLERDAVNNRAWLTELGKRPPHYVPRWMRFSRRGQKVWIGAIKSAQAAGDVTTAIIRNRKLRRVLHAGLVFALDLMLVLTALSLTMAAIAVGYALFVPPI